MKVIQRTISASPSGISQPGEIVDLPKAEALARINSGQGEALDETIETKRQTKRRGAKQAETATREQGEQRAEEGAE